MADHRVQGVHRPIAEQAGNAGHRAPEQRRDHGVGGVLGQRLHGGPGHLVGGQSGGLPPDQIAHPVARRFKIIGGQLTGDDHGLAGE